MHHADCPAKGFQFPLLTNGEPLTFQHELQLIKINEKIDYITFFLLWFLERLQNHSPSVSFPQMSVKMVRNCNPRSLINGIKITFAMRAGKERT